MPNHKSVPHAKDTPLYKREFPDFDSDLTPVLEQLPVKFSDHSWHNDICPRFEYAKSDDQSAYPRLVLWLDYEAPVSRELNAQRFTLQILRCADDAELLVASEEIAPVAAAVQRIINDGVSMRMHKTKDFEGRPCLCLLHDDTDIENPFLSECGRFAASPAAYGLDLVSGSIFLRAMPIDQLRDAMGCAIGNTETFDACTSDEEKRQFAIDYLAAILGESSGRAHFAHGQIANANAA